MCLYLYLEMYHIDLDAEINIFCFLLPILINYSLFVYLSLSEENSVVRDVSESTEQQAENASPNARP